MRAKFSAAIILMMLLLGSSAATAEELIKNDSIGENIDSVVASAALVEDEMYEAVFDIPEDWLPIEMLGVQVVMVEGACQFGVCPDLQTFCQRDSDCGPFCGRFTLKVWEEGMNMPQTTSCGMAGQVEYKDPGMMIFDGDSVVHPQSGSVLGWEIQGDPRMGNANVQEMRFSAFQQYMVNVGPVNLTTPRVRVGVKALDLACGGGANPGKAFPIMVTDQDGVSRSYQNFVFGEPQDAFGNPMCNVSGKQHFVWEDFAPAFNSSQPGDFFLRLIVDRDGDTGGDMGMSDAGSDAGMDMGSSDMGGGDMSRPDAGSGDDIGSGGEGDAATGGGELAVESVTPSEGTAGESTNIVILGSGFVSGAEVLLGAENIGVTETKSERIKANVPDTFEVGTYDLIVTNPDGESASLAEAFTIAEGDDDGDSSGGRASSGCGCDSTSASVSSVAMLLVAAFFLFAGRLRRRRVRTPRD